MTTNEIEPTQTITHQELENVISKYIMEHTAIEPGRLSKGLSQEIMNYLAKKIHPDKEEEL